MLLKIKYIFQMVLSSFSLSEAETSTVAVQPPMARNAQQSTDSTGDLQPPTLRDEEMESDNTADFRGQTGPRLPDNFDVLTASALDFFYLLFHPAMFADMAWHTNNYARWKEMQDQPDDKWAETNENEMKAFIGNNVLMGINALPELDMYWSSNPLAGNSAIQNIMTFRT
ncbi:piggyBac transposable element-derived protein 4-like [Mercenaria mercenaria]|uniref:piggyBac transposable element-derived protein 4-like n=1 Tax=Mercenaria mercenaria TaxID=6596 RepID=UPI00234F2A26|nr:piggyBac transposable element-derived protein 4-like [Mercenaria mercenaria]